MKVKELIKALEKAPQEAYVFHYNVKDETAAALGVIGVKVLQFGKDDRLEVHISTLL